MVCHVLTQHVIEDTCTLITYTLRSASRNTQYLINKRAGVVEEVENTTALLAVELLESRRFAIKAPQSLAVEINLNPVPL